MKLRVTEINKWEGRIKAAYKEYRDGIAKDYSLMQYTYGNYTEKVKAYIIERLDWEINIVKSNQMKTKGSWLDHLSVKLPFVEDILSEEERSAINASNKSACEKIRAICEPVSTERDRLISLLYKSPTREELDEIEEWCNKYKPPKSIGCGE